MAWNIIVICVVVGINAVFGLFRGWKNALERFVIMAVALYISIGLSCLLQVWSGFELIAWVENTGIINPEAIDQVIGGLTTIVPLGSTLAPIINTMLLGDYCSIIVAIIIFLVVNKLGLLLYHIVAGIGRTSERVQIADGKKKLKITHGVGSTIVGTLIGALQGVLVSIIIFSPICELITGLTIFGA